jgi:ribosomal protein L37AE/L43A
MSLTEPALAAPTRCPFCQSSAVSATGQRVNESTYWRCEKCGQVWHPGRLRLQNQFDTARRR